MPTHGVRLGDECSECVVHLSRRRQSEGVQHIAGRVDLHLSKQRMFGSSGQHQMWRRFGRTSGRSTAAGQDIGAPEAWLNQGLATPGASALEGN